MEITYDKTCDCLYIKLNDEFVAETEMDEKSGAIIDYADNGTIVGLEIINASSKVSNPTIANLKFL